MDLIILFLSLFLNTYPTKSGLKFEKVEGIFKILNKNTLGQELALLANEFIKKDVDSNRNFI